MRLVQPFRRGKNPRSGETNEEEGIRLIERSPSGFRVETRLFLQMVDGTFFEQILMLNAYQNWRRLAINCDQVESTGVLCILLLCAFRSVG